MKRIFTIAIVILLAVNSKAQDIESGLVLRLSFCGNTNDLSSFVNNAEYMGNSVVYTTDHLGNENSAIYFDGFSDWVRVPASASINEPVDAITIACWAKYESLAFGQWAPIMAKTNTNEVLDRQYSLGLNGLEGKIYMMDTYVGEAELLADTWYHYTITYTPELYQCYLNGELIGEVEPNSPVTGNNKDLEIGRDTPQSTDYFHGSLDEINVFNRVLSADDILALKNYDGCNFSSVNEQKLQESFQIVPNPATGQITLQLPDDAIYQVSIMDIQGRLIHQIHNQQHQVKAAVSGFQSGMYLIRIVGDKGFAVEKLLVE
ncbi:MAG: T9SS type A sorting domain-containing protein [Bacteroidales bacterium]|jgi:hypothetical protein|nr:T9SS type A sorting domain-containing protein [Bacteroidales bacterium]MDD4087262.1 T9SS type A sorting domain-containing protein [Bacteroidales bacterium]